MKVKHVLYPKGPLSPRGTIWSSNRFLWTKILLEFFETFLWMCSYARASWIYNFYFNLMPSEEVMGAFRQILIWGSSWVVIIWLIGVKGRCAWYIGQKNNSWGGQWAKGWDHWPWACQSPWNFMPWFYDKDSRIQELNLHINKKYQCHLTNLP